MNNILVAQLPVALAQPPQANNAFYGMKAGSLYNLLLVFGLAAVFTGLGFLFARKAVLRKVSLIVLWAGLILNYILFGLSALGEGQLSSTLQHNPISFVQMYVLQYMGILPIIFLGIAVFSKKGKGRLAKIISVFLIAAFGLMCLLLPGYTENRSYVETYVLGGESGGLRMGLLYDSIFWNYIVNNVLYVVIPAYLIAFGAYKPKLRDVPIAMLSLVGAFLIAYLYNDLMILTGSRLDIFHPHMDSIFYSNVFYTHYHDGSPFLKFLWNISGGTKLLYLFWLLIPAVLIFSLFCLPFYKKEDYKNARKNIKQYFKDLGAYWKNAFTQKVGLDCEEADEKSKKRKPIAPDKPEKKKGKAEES